MRLESMLRLLGGVMVMLTVVLGMFVHPAFFWGTLFVGANLFQSGLSNWCPAVPVLKRCGVRHDGAPSERRAA